jgi:hypothetical protein
MRHAQSNRPQSGSSTDSHLGVDKMIQNSLDHGSTADGLTAQQYEEGFGASSGIRPEVAETGGRLKAPEMKDDAIPDRTPNSPEKENAGLADS